MLFGWLKRRRRKRLLSQSFPDNWDGYLRHNVRHFERLSESEQASVRGAVQVLVTEKNWEGCGGLEMTDEVKVTIAAQIGILVMGLEEEYFDRVLSILVYPNAYVASGQHAMHTGLIVHEGAPREGEAWYRGPVILSWDEVLEGGRYPFHGRNLVYHEFAHQLDMLNGGDADGVPPLESSDTANAWVELLDREYEQLIDDCQYGRPSVFDCYGATNKAEFFAVASESFLETPLLFRKKHPELYRLFREYYRQDPATRVPKHMVWF